MRNDVIEEDLAKVCDCQPLSGVCVCLQRTRSKSSHILGPVPELDSEVGGWSVKKEVKTTRSFPPTEVWM